MPVPIVSVSWLAAQLDDPSLVLLDASLQPAATASVNQGMPSLLLPRARVFDFDKRICDQQTSLPHMMPRAQLFEAEVRALGIHQASQIVVYDRFGVYSSPRAWWMFKAMGHDRVSVLDGGLPAWLEAGLPCDSVAHSSPFSAVQTQGHMREAAELVALLGSKVHGDSSQLIFSCGSGVTACILALAGTLAGYSKMAVYDGSWSEWGMPSSRPAIVE